MFEAGQPQEGLRSDNEFAILVMHRDNRVSGDYLLSTWDLVDLLSVLNRCGMHSPRLQVLQKERAGPLAASNAHISTTEHSDRMSMAERRRNRRAHLYRGMGSFFR